MEFLRILEEAILAQPAPEAAGGWQEYLIYGVIVAIIGFIFYQAFRPKPELKSKPEPHKPQLEPSDLGETAEKAPQASFHVPHVEARGVDTRVRLSRKDAAPPPTGLPTPEPAPEPIPEPTPEPAPEPKPQPSQKRGKRPPRGGRKIKKGRGKKGKGRGRVGKKPPKEKSSSSPAPAASPEPKPAPTRLVLDEVLHLEEAGQTLRDGLSKTHEGFVKRLGRLFSEAKSLDDNLLAELEEALFTADIGVKTSLKLVERIQEQMKRAELKDPHKVWEQLKGEIGKMLHSDAPPLDLEQAKPLIIMVVGVNGAGKTTTIGKLARQYQEEGKRVILAAGDTFRAAAVEQLEVWAERAGVPVVKGRSEQDPSSVIFGACQRAQQEGYDICIADTAGRLQAKRELMDELSKINRVIGRAVPGAPHEVWLVLDATNGQNAISQAQEFTKVVPVTGLILSKLDGTAKGGVVIGISDEMQLPVRYIGVGERVEDLQLFKPGKFAQALFGDL